MNEQPLCPRCGTAFLADAPAGLCPKCLVQAALESGAAPEPPASGGSPAGEPTQASPARPKSGFEAPSLEELVPLFPQLEILELLGKGGMGAVYKARQRGLDRLVALKILPPEIGNEASFAERFTREARALARLSHNHIVSVFDFGRAKDLYFIVMEYVDGANLRQAILAGGMTPREALAIVPQICEALQFAHDEGIVHRDIKPENILLDKRGRVKIADFGLAKLLGQEAGDHSLTATHQVMGTLRYMAPEQMQGSREVDHRADIYSLGVVFYELLTGELPMGRFAPPSRRVQVDVRLDEIVLRALEQRPEQRYQHASEIKSDVESFASTPRVAPGSPVSVPVAAAGASESGTRLLMDETDRRARRHQHFFLIGGFVWILLGLVSALVFWSGDFLGLLPIPVALWIGGVAAMVAAGRVRQQWEIDYLGHSVRFENSVFTSGLLLIDAKSMASGGIGPRTELAARIPSGPGAGDRIVVKTYAGFLSFHCRIFVEPKASISDGRSGAPPPVTTQPRGWLGVPVWVRFVVQAALSIACLALFLMFISFASSGSTQQDQRSVLFTFGVPDPWFTYEMRPEGSGMSLNIVRWSFAAGVASALVFWLLLALHRIERGERVRDKSECADGSGPA